MKSFRYLARLDPGSPARAAYVLRYAERVRRDLSRSLVAETAASDRDPFLTTGTIATAAIDVTP